VILGATLYNLGGSAVDSFSVSYFYSDADLGRVLFAERTIATALPADSALHIQQAWPSLHRTGNRQLTMQIDRNNDIYELNENNNRVIASVTVLEDTLTPRIEVTFDNKKIHFGEFVDFQPKIIGYIRDNSPAATDDTTSVHVLLDGVRVTYASNDALEIVRAQNEDDPSLRATVLFEPTLDEGEHTLEFFFSDAKGNSAYHREDFEVASELAIRDVLNYPNPFHAGTELSYVLTMPATRVTLKVYTLAGRLIYETDALPTEAGFNSEFWDGNDSDGDRLANGVYLYKIIAATHDVQAEVLQKLIVMR
jgi:hypothetical protein